MINELLSNPNSNDALLLLPGYLEKAGKFEDLLSYLSPENFSKLIACSESLGPVQKQASLGVKIAKRLGRDGDLIRFSSQMSVIFSFSRVKVWKSEVEALISLNDFDTALALAQSSLLKEDQLHLLAVLAKKKSERGLSIEKELRDQIRKLYFQINPIELGDRAVDIAADLIYTNPDLAIELVEKATATDTSNGALDWAFAKLSIAASLSKDEAKSTDLIELIHQRIKDPKAREMTSTVSMLLGNYSAKEVIAEANKFENINEKTYLFRIWSMENRERDDAIEVVDYAIMSLLK